MDILRIDQSARSPQKINPWQLVRFKCYKSCSPFKAGQVVELSERILDSLKIAVNLRNLPCTPLINEERFLAGFFRDHPECFRKLEWWEERRELPISVMNIHSMETSPVIQWEFPFRVQAGAGVWCIEDVMPVA